MNVSTPPALAAQALGVAWLIRRWARGCLWGRLAGDLGRQRCSLATARIGL